MRASSRRFLILACSTFGVVVAAIVYCCSSNAYVSSAVLKITPTVNTPNNPSPVLGREANERVELLHERITGRAGILHFLELVHSKLYAEELEKSPTEDLAERLHKAGAIRFLPARPWDGRSLAVRVEFSYRQRAESRDGLRVIVHQLQDENDDLNRDLASKWISLWSAPIPFQQKIELVQPPDYPSDAAAWRRLLAALSGVLGAVLSVMIVAIAKRGTFGLARPLAWGLLACAIAGGIALLLPGRYESRAVLRVRAPFDPATVSGQVPMIDERACMAQAWTNALEQEPLWSGLRTKTGLDLDSAGVTGLYKNRIRDFEYRSLDWSEDVAGPSFEVKVVASNKLRAPKVLGELITQIQEQYTRTCKAAGSGSEPLEITPHAVGNSLIVVVSPTAGDRSATL